MITTALVYFAGLIIQILLLAMSPLQGSNGFPVAIDAKIAYLNTFISKANTLIPLDSVNAFITFVIIFETTVATFYILRWLFGYLPLVGGR